MIGFGGYRKEGETRQEWRRRAALRSSGIMTIWTNWEFLLRCAVAAGIAYVVYRVIIYQTTDFEIRLHNGVVAFKGRVPFAQRSALVEFLVHDLGPDRTVTIRGLRRGKRQRLWFRGQLSDGEKQRIRNFLAMTF